MKLKSYLAGEFIGFFFSPGSVNIPSGSADLWSWIMDPDLGGQFITYGSGRISRIRILPWHFCGHWKNKYVADSSKSLIIELFWIFNKKSEDPNPYFRITDPNPGDQLITNSPHSERCFYVVLTLSWNLQFGSVWWDGPGGSIFFTRVFVEQNTHEHGGDCGGSEGGAAPPHHRSTSWGQGRYHQVHR